MSDAGDGPQHATPERPVPGSLVAMVVLLGAVGPLATDTYLPGFSRVTRDLHTTQGIVALTLTTFFAGMSLGQLVGGPLSDRLGRRRPLVVATVGLLLASVCCALAPSIAILLTARFLQGLSGGCGMVVGRAVLVDLTRGTRLVRMMNLVMALGSIAPLVGPLIGAALIRWGTWRWCFWGIAVLAALQLAGSLVFVPETLPPERRHGGGLRVFGRRAAALARRRVFVGYVLVAGCAMLALHSYISQSPFVLQDVDGLSPTQYSLVFATNAFGIVLMTSLSTRLAGRVDTRRVLVTGLVLQLLGGALMTAGLGLGSPLWTVWPAFFLLTSGLGLVGGNAGALASAEATDMAGTGSAVVGVCQFLAAAVAPAIVTGLGQHSVWPVAAMMSLMPALALVSVAVLTSRRR